MSTAQVCDTCGKLIDPEGGMLMIHSIYRRLSGQTTSYPLRPLASYHFHDGLCAAAWLGGAMHDDDAYRDRAPEPPPPPTLIQDDPAAYCAKMFLAPHPQRPSEVHSWLCELPESHGGRCGIPRYDRWGPEPV